MPVFGRARGSGSITRSGPGAGKRPFGSPSTIGTASLLSMSYATGSATTSGRTRQTRSHSICRRESSTTRCLLMLSSAWYPLPRKSLPKKRLEKGATDLVGGRSATMSLTLTNPGAVSARRTRACVASTSNGTNSSRSRPTKRAYGPSRPQLEEDGNSFKNELTATVLVVIVGFTAADATDRGVHFHRAQTFGQPSAPEYAGRRAIAE